MMNRYSYIIQDATWIRGAYFIESYDSDLHVKVKINKVAIKGSFEVYQLQREQVQTKAMYAADGKVVIEQRFFGLDETDGSIHVGPLLATGSISPKGRNKSLDIISKSAILKDLLGEEFDKAVQVHEVILDIQSKM